MKKYDSYKDSGIEWIGEIPSHWKKSRLAFNGEFYKGKGVSKIDLSIEGLPVMLYGDIYTKYNLKTEKLVRHIPIEVAQNSFSIEKGDLLFAASGETPDEIGKCICYLGEDEAYASGDVIVFRQKSNDSVFLSYLFNSYKVNEQKAKLSKGEIVVHIYSGQLRDIRFPLPPSTEQTAIATYLDRKTAEIDELIADKKRLLELYEEEKTAIINQAVTKGINPDVPMKDSGIEWLGEIPEHWEVKKVKHLVLKVGSGITPSGGASVYKLSGIPLLRSQNIHFDGLRLDDVAYITEDIHESMKNSQVLSGDVLLNITGASIGRAYFVESWLGEANVNQHVCILRPNSETDTRFLYFILRSNIGQEQIRIEQTGSGREGLNFEALKNFILPFLSIEEQQSIVRHIETECERIDTQVARTKKLIELLKEYREALVSEVVTGKIKVI